MATPNRRQLWIGGVAKWCDHTILEGVRSEGGTLIADVCKACGMRLAEYGTCAGCKRERRLTHFVAAKRKAFCTVDCYRATVAAATKAKKEALAELAKAGK